MLNSKAKSALTTVSIFASLYTVLTFHTVTEQTEFPKLGFPRLPPTISEGTRNTASLANQTGVSDRGELSH